MERFFFNSTDFINNYIQSHPKRWKKLSPGSMTKKDHFRNCRISSVKFEYRAKIYRPVLKSRSVTQLSPKWVVGGGNCCGMIDLSNDLKYRRWLASANPIFWKRQNNLLIFCRSRFVILAKAKLFIYSNLFKIFSK